MEPDPRTVTQPFDHNAECRFCDEQAMHRADCPWLMALEAKVAELDAQLLALREHLAAERRCDVFGHAQLAEVVRDYAAKLQLLVNTMAERGQLPEGVFTFPDGDTWEAKHGR